MCYGSMVTQPFTLMYEKENKDSAVSQGTAIHCIDNVCSSLCDPIRNRVGFGSDGTNNRSTSHEHVEYHQ